MNNTITPEADTKSVPTGLEASSATSTNSPKKRLIATLVLVLLLLGAGGLVISRLLGKEKTSYLTNDHAYFCTSLGFDFMQCENVETNEISKYRIPEGEKLSSMRSLSASPDGKKFLLSSWTEDSFDFYVVDEKFELRHDFGEADFETASNTEYIWASADQLIRSTATIDGRGHTQQVHLVDTETWEERLVYESSDTESQYRIIGGDENRLYGSQIAPFNESAPQAEPDLYFAINVSDGTVTPINARSIQYAADGSQVSSSAQMVAYNANKRLFYFYGHSASDASRNVLSIARLEGDSELSFRQVFETDLKLAGINPLMTSRGLQTQAEDEVFEEFPITFIDQEGKTHELTMPLSGDSRGFAFTTPVELQLPKEADSRPAVADFVQAPAETPESIVEFLKSRVQCSDNEYATITLDKRLGIEQLKVGGGCDGPHANYYLLRDGAYEKVASSSHGLGCEERDKAGLSPELVDCLKPGEGF